MRTSSSQQRIHAPATLLWMVLFLPIPQALGETPRQQALQLEKQGRWFEACCLYDELLSKDRNQPELRDAYRRCLRHFRQQRRLDDLTLQSLLSKLSAAESGSLYDQILRNVDKFYVDRDQIDLTDLFQQGIREVRSALEKKSFLQRHLGRLTEGDLASFRLTLDRWGGEKITDRDGAGQIARRIILAASQQGIPAGLIALELACGAANSLDEYSLYLAPSRLSQAMNADKNKIVGIGAEVALVAQKLEISRVFRKSPASEVGLIKGDRINRIDGQEIDPLAPDLAAERLLGLPGSLVELEIIPRGQTMPQLIKIERQAVLLNSVDAEVRGEMGSYVGYMHVHAFQESTLQEIKDILMGWQAMPLRGVILDLRGNPGGLLKSALQVAELFLPRAVIAHTTSPLARLARTWESQNSAPFALPLVVLVDGDTASSAEVLAGALKDNQRAVVLGQPTYGKGSIQCFMPLDRVPGGLRLTVAKFTTPSKAPLNGRGIIPNQVIADPDPEVAIKEAERLLRAPVMMVQ